MSFETTVFVVDDDPDVRKSLQRLIESVRLPVETFGSAQEFLEAYDPMQPGCLVLDVRMPGMSGLELQERLARDHRTLPVIIITAHGDLPMAVQAMKHGAVDVIEKPFRDQILLDRIQQAIDRDAKSREEAALRADINSRLQQLTPREREVLDMLIGGNRNKAIAEALGVSQKTVEFHRANIMTKMRANTLADVVRQALGVRGAAASADPTPA